MNLISNDLLELSCEPGCELKHIPKIELKSSGEGSAIHFNRINEPFYNIHVMGTQIIIE